MDDVPIDIGPRATESRAGRRSIFFDPSGNRNEVFAGGYLVHRDRPINKWTPDDQIAKGHLLSRPRTQRALHHRSHLIGCAPRLKPAVVRPTAAAGESNSTPTLFD